MLRSNNSYKEILMLHISFVITLTSFLFGFVFLERKELKNDLIPSNAPFIDNDVIKIISIVTDKRQIVKPTLPHISNTPVIDEEIELLEEINIKAEDIIKEKTADFKVDEKPIPNIVDFPHTQAILIKKVKAEYPEIARLLSKETKLIVQFIISEEGIPKDIKVLSGNELFHESAIKAIKQYRYKAGRWNGKAVKVRKIIPFIYKLN